MKSYRSSAIRTAVLVAGALVATAAVPQVTAFRNFKQYPASGQWQQEGTTFRNGKALAPPATSTTCAGPLDAKTATRVAELAKGSGQACTSKVLVDQKDLAESETVCRMGPNVQTVHLQMRPVDDRTIATEIRTTVSGVLDSVTKIRATYLGACPAGMAEAQAKPSAADCAEVANARKEFEAAGGAAQCAQYPAQVRGQCEAGLKMMALMAQRCE